MCSKEASAVVVVEDLNVAEVTDSLRVWLGQLLRAGSIGNDAWRMPVRPQKPSHELHVNGGIVDSFVASLHTLIACSCGYVCAYAPTSRTVSVERILKTRRLYFFLKKSKLSFQRSAHWLEQVVLTGTSCGGASGLHGAMIKGSTQ